MTTNTQQPNFNQIAETKNLTERQKIEQQYLMVDGRIFSPGKFEGEPVFAPYFWDIALSGFADSDNGSVYGFRFNFSSEQDKAILKDFPELKKWLGRKRSLKLIEDSQGFVYCR